MILTHILVLLSAAPVVVVPLAATLPITDGGALMALPRRAAALLPALPVRLAPVLAVRGD
jgi:hypothetical protein